MGQNKSILGYSEGATTAATLILEEQRLFREQGRPRRIKVRGPISSPLLSEYFLLHLYNRDVGSMLTAC